MNIRTRFHDGVPEDIDGVERLVILHGGVEIEIVPFGDGGLQVRLDHPLGKHLTVYPKAGNTIALHATREPGT